MEHPHHLTGGAVVARQVLLLGDDLLNRFGVDGVLAQKGYNFQGSWGSNRFLNHLIPQFRQRFN